MRGLLACAFLWLAGPADAWQAITNDDGVLYYGAARFGAGLQTVEVFCAGKSPAGRPPPPDYPGEYQSSPPGVLSLAVAGALIGEPAGGADMAERGDVTFVIAGQGYKIPALSWELLFSNWTFPLDPDGAFVRAMASGQDVLMQLDGGQAWLLGGQGAPVAFGQMQSFCGGYSGAAAVADPAVSAMENAAHAHIFRGCEGQAQADPGYLLKGDLDRDGTEDAVVDWEKIRCPGAFARPFCGASTCAADVFLSMSYRAGGQPETILAQGVRMEPSPMGGMQLVTGGSLSMCQGRSSCDFVWFWTGREWARQR